MENSKKLLKLQVDFGPCGMRQIVSGIANYLKPEDLVGVQAVFVCNLPERKMGGELSQGMLVGVDDGANVFSPLLLSCKIPNGARVK
jgi:methionyl-tRNA synthetase